MNRTAWLLFGSVCTAIAIIAGACAVREPSAVDAATVDASASDAFARDASSKEERSATRGIDSGARRLESLVVNGGGSGSAGPATNLDLAGQEAGAVAYLDDAGQWQALNPGAAGQVLTTNGAGRAPAWQDASAGGGASFTAGGDLTGDASAQWIATINGPNGAGGTVYVGDAGSVSLSVSQTRASDASAGGGYPLTFPVNAPANPNNGTVHSAFGVKTTTGYFPGNGGFYDPTMSVGYNLNGDSLTEPSAGLSLEVDYVNGSPGPSARTIEHYLFAQQAGSANQIRPFSYTYDVRTGTAATFLTFSSAQGLYFLADSTPVLTVAYDSAGHNLGLTDNNGTDNLGIAANGNVTVTVGAGKQWNLAGGAASTGKMSGDTIVVTNGAGTNKGFFQTTGTGLVLSPWTTNTGALGTSSNIFAAARVTTGTFDSLVGGASTGALQTTSPNTVFEQIGAAGAGTVGTQRRKRYRCEGVATTINATPTAVITASSSDCMNGNVPNASSMMIECHATGRVTVGNGGTINVGDAVGDYDVATAKNLAGTTAIVGSVTGVSLNADTGLSGAGAGATIAVTGATWAATVTGAASTTIQWEVWCDAYLN